jgi:hypothetical protein
MAFLSWIPPSPLLPKSYPTTFLKAPYFGAERRPGVEGGGVTSGVRKGTSSGVSTSPSQLGSITRLHLRSVSRHRGQRLFLQVRGGCQSTTNGESVAPEWSRPCTRLETTGVISHCPEFSIKLRYSEERNSTGRSVMPRGLRTTRQTQQHLCQIKPQPRRRNRRFVSQHGMSIVGQPVTELQSPNIKASLTYHTLNLNL